MDFTLNSAPVSAFFFGLMFQLAETLVNSPLSIPMLQTVFSVSLGTLTLGRSCIHGTGVTFPSFGGAAVAPGPLGPCPGSLGCGGEPAETTEGMIPNLELGKVSKSFRVRNSYSRLPTGNPDRYLGVTRSAVPGVRRLSRNVSGTVSSSDSNGIRKR